MECPVLVTDKKYSGKYVALQSFNDTTVVASGKDPAKVMATAIKKGVASPVIVHIPGENQVNVYRYACSPMSKSPPRQMRKI